MPFPPIIRTFVAALLLSPAALPQSAHAGDSSWASSLGWAASSVKDATAAYAGKAASYLPAKPSWATMPSLPSWATGWEPADLTQWMPEITYGGTRDAVAGWGSATYALLPSWQGVTSLADRRWLPEGTHIDLRQAFDAGLEIIPKDPNWYVDFGATTAVVGTVVGSASFACAVVATPGGPVLVALAPAACSLVGSYAGDLMVHAGYRAWMGREVDEGAAMAGTLVGSISGMAVGSWAYGRYAAAQVWSRYQSFRGYSKAARSLTRQELKPWRPEVKGFRAQGYDMDHVVPVKCGWVLGMAPMAIADIGNIQALPSRINRSIGSKGC